MRASAYFLVFSLFLFSCNSDKPKKLLSEKEMASIMADFVIYEQDIKEQNETSADEKSNFVLKKNKITKEIFKENYNYYASKQGKIASILNMSEEILLEKNIDFKKKIQKQNSTSKKEEDKK